MNVPYQPRNYNLHAYRLNPCSFHLQKRTLCPFKAIPEISGVHPDANLHPVATVSVYDVFLLLSQPITATLLGADKHPVVLNVIFCRTLGAESLVSADTTVTVPTALAGDAVTVVLRAHRSVTVYVRDRLDPDLMHFSFLVLTPLSRVSDLELKP